jgi:hypothetical protein
MKTETLTIRINSDVLDKVREEANEELRTIAKQIELILRDHIKAYDFLKTNNGKGNIKY